MERLFDSVNNEVTEIEGDVKGSIPDWVNGSLFRNGPMMYELGDSHLKHLFDGMAGLQRWKIKDGKVTYQRKLVQSESLKKSMDANRFVITQFGTYAYPDPCKNIFQRFAAFFTSEEISDNTAVTTWPQKDRVFVSTETHITHEIDPETMETKNSMHLPDYLTINMATAHCHWEADGTVHGFGTFNRGKDPSYSLYTIPPLADSKEAFKNIKVVGKVPARWQLHPGYLHSFSLTEKYYVFPEQTLALSIPSLALMKFTQRSIEEALKWYPNEKTLYHIMDRKTGQPVNPKLKYYGDAQFTFHHINAYEEDGFLILDMCAYKDNDIIKRLYLKNLKDFMNNADPNKNFGFGDVRRFVFPLNVDENTPMNENLVTLPGCQAKAVRTAPDEIYCQHELLFGADEGGFELPQINYLKYNGKKYKYTYGVGGLFESLVKFDMETKERIEWKEKDCSVSEPVFLPAPDGVDEDDGIVMSAVTHHGDGNKPFLLVQDGRTFKEKARVEFDTERFSFDFHGFFRPQQ